MYGVTSIIGLALIIAPFFLRYSNHPVALWVSITLGTIVSLTAGYKALVNDRANWERWVVGMTGVVMIIAPFMFGFRTILGALCASIIVGTIVAAVAAYDYLARPTAQ